MTVQTIPTIEEMTPFQRAELMEELWKAMSKRPENIDVPERHRRILGERRAAVERGEIDYIDWEDAKRQIRSQIKCKSEHWVPKGNFTADAEFLSCERAGRVA